MDMLRKAILLGSLAAGVAATMPASAQWYVGAAVGRTNNEWEPTGLAGDKDTSTVSKAFFGRQLSPQVSVEAGYANLGRFVDFGSTTAQVEAQSLAFSLLGTLAVAPQVDMFARLGVGAARSKWSLGGANGTKTNLGPVVGLGVNFRTALAQRSLVFGFEWEQYQNVGEGAMAGPSRLMGQNVDTLMLRIVYHLDLLPG